jgi:DNA repair protein RadD
VEASEDNDVLLGTIGTLYRRVDKLGSFELCMVDECHLISRQDEGMYRKLIATLHTANPDMRVVGWTGTPFRGNGVWLTAGESRLFTDVATRLSMRELLDEGFLAPLVTAQTDTTINSEGISTSAGDYNIGELAARIDQPETTNKVADELVRLASDRKKWLVYGVTVNHAAHLCEALKARRIAAAIVSAETPKDERERIIEKFRRGYVRAIVNVAVLTTGFDVPEVDCIALVRNTKSPVLYVQIAGRGMRIHPQKRDCLWLDFTDTTARLGPVDAVRGRMEPRKREAESTVDGKKLCDNCGAANPPAAARCHCCGQVFDSVVSKVNLRASKAAILSGQPHEPDIQTFIVDKIQCVPKTSKQGKPYLKVIYRCELEMFSKNLMLGMGGWAGAKAQREWDEMTGMAIPVRNPGEAFRLIEDGVIHWRNVHSIDVDLATKYQDIVKVHYCDNLTQ